jgi:hypothetical protein
MRAFVIPALILLLLAACSVGSNADLSNDNGTAGISSGGQPGSSELPSTLEFEQVGELAAREQIGLTLQALPPKVYHVRFALPSDAGDPLDAVLDRAEADTDENGVATVVLTASSGSATFAVRASVANQVTAKLMVTVKDSGFAVVQVQPSYPSLLRDPTTWIATAHPNKTCADVPGIPPPDGPLQATPAAKGEAPVITGVPAGTPLAITLRSGHFVGGCASVAQLPPGPTKQLVEVAVLNRPIDLAASKLSISLGLAAPETSWSGLLTSAESAVLMALPGTSTDDIDMLLDAMRDVSTDERQAFEAARKAEGWDALLKASWGASASSKLRDVVKSWLGGGRETFGALQQPLLEGRIDPGGASQSNAHLTLLKVAGLEPKRAGFASPTLVSWSAGSDDNVTIGTDIYVVASELATALAEQSALADSNGATTAVEALDEAVDCSVVAATLVAAGSQAALAYGTCDAACLESSCRQALDVIWLRGSAATGLDPARMIVTATGHAHVGDVAEVAGMGGSWIGELRGANGTQKTGGNLTATATVE